MPPNNSEFLILNIMIFVIYTVKVLKI